MPAAEVTGPRKCISVPRYKQAAAIGAQRGASLLARTGALHEAQARAGGHSGPRSRLLNSEHDQAPSKPLESDGRMKGAGVRAPRLLVPLRERYDYVQISEGWLAHYVSAHFSPYRELHITCLLGQLRTGLWLAAEWLPAHLLVNPSLAPSSRARGRETVLCAQRRAVIFPGLSLEGAGI